MNITNDYVERVYAGVLGKIIGVYVGRPFEGWPYERIMQELGEIHYYVHEQRGVPLIVTDDDISGTFTFFRALADYGNSTYLTAEEIGQTWLNYLIEERTILWWGGMGQSTEHTAFLRLKSGIPAPQSGSVELNGKVVSEQIGAQIFIDAWAMACPGDPELATDLARRAASVSHDGEAIYGAQVVAAIEAQAFVESDMNALIDTAVTFIPKDSIIYRLIGDVRNWHQQDGDWRRTRERIVADYGYDKYGGNCHMVPNHALIMLGILYGADDFQRALMITNTAGWDTDCNSANVGCIMGLVLGLDGINAGPDWRGPVADRLYLPTADGGRAITDAVRETYEIVKTAQAMAEQTTSLPKNGARYHFELPGSVQGFVLEDSPECKGTAVVENIEGHSASGQRSLAIRYQHIAKGRTARVATATFVPPEAMRMGGYSLIASPTLYSGQKVRGRVIADSTNTIPVVCSPYLRYYAEGERLALKRGKSRLLSAGQEWVFEWLLESIDGAPITEIGVEVASDSRADGSIYLDYLTWSGSPSVAFHRPLTGGNAWQRAWVNAVDNVHFTGHGQNLCRVIQNQGTGLLIQGTREWQDYAFSATVRPHLAASTGIAVCVQGQKRYYALLLCNDQKLRLVKELDGRTVLAEQAIDWQLGQEYALALQTTGAQLVAEVDGHTVFEIDDPMRPLLSGSVALVCAEGRVEFGSVSVESK